MKKFGLIGLLAAAGMGCTAFGQGMVISQVYGAGGNAGATYNQDFIELHNNSGAPIDISGWSVQYGSAAGNIGGTTELFLINVIPAATIVPAGGYYLIGGATGANGVALPVAPDFQNTPATSLTNLSGTAGKVALVNNATRLSVPCPMMNPSVVDLVGYGTAANCNEGGTNAPPFGNNANSIQRNVNGCTDTDVNGSDFTAGAVLNVVRNSTSPVFTCGSFVDCNNNGVNDPLDISSGTSLDCNGNQVPDECDISSGFATDCNTNTIPDSCDIALGTLSDNNGNGTPDGCEDCNGNMIQDRLDIASGFSTDCNTNNIPDSCDLLTGRLTDCNLDGTADACQGAAVQTAVVNGTVRPAGVRAAPNGSAFFNVQGANGLTNASYGGVRWDLAPIAAQFDAALGAGAWEIDRAYLQLMQSNAAFTLNGGVRINHSFNDTTDLTPGVLTTQYANLLVDFNDLVQIQDYAFMQGIINGDGSGTIECYNLFDFSGVNNTGQTNVASEINGGLGQLTLILNETDPGVAATYAGRTNFTWRGPTLIVFARARGGCTVTCDVNGDGGADNADVFDLSDAIASGSNLPNAGACKDYNQDGGEDNSDVLDMADAIAGGTCP